MDKVSQIIFLLLCLFISLFPPFSWGNERLLTDKSQNEYYNTYKARDVLPIKQYDFVFNDMKKEFSFGWTWERYRGSYEVREVLTRHIIISELLINYLLAFLISLIISVLMKKRSPVNC